jgi:hypothetical protein
MNIHIVHDISGQKRIIQTYSTHPGSHNYENIHVSSKDSMAGGSSRVNYSDFSGYFRRVAAVCSAVEKEEARRCEDVETLCWKDAT